MKYNPARLLLIILAIVVVSCGGEADDAVVEPESITRESQTDPSEPTHTIIPHSIEVDPDLPEYERVSGISGNITSVGSDTMNNLMALLCEGFTRIYPNVRCQIQGAGSSTAPPALEEGTAQFGAMSRAMTNRETDNFERSQGYPPTRLSVGIDTLVLYVNRNNPLKCISIQQVDAVFSRTLNCGHHSRIRTWGDLGLGGNWANRPISIYGRNSASGTYGFFKEEALCKGDFKPEVREQPGSASVVHGIANDIFGIGYSGIGYATSGVKIVELAKEPGKCAAPTPENVASGDYPLARFLYIYINRRPGEELDPLRMEFLRFVLSRQGQEEVAKDGFMPIPEVVASEMRRKLTD